MDIGDPPRPVDEEDLIPAPVLPKQGPVGVTVYSLDGQVWVAAPRGDPFDADSDEPDLPAGEAEKTSGSGPLNRHGVGHGSGRRVRLSVDELLASADGHGEGPPAPLGFAGLASLGAGAPSGAAGPWAPAPGPAAAEAASPPFPDFQPVGRTQMPCPR